MLVAVVTDSTAYLPKVDGVWIVPVQVISDGISWDENIFPPSSPTTPFPTLSPTPLPSANVYTKPTPNHPTPNQPGPDQPGPDQPGPDQPDPNDNNPSRPDLNRPDLNRPDLNRPDLNWPGPNDNSPNQNTPSAPLSTDPHPSPRDSLRTSHPIAESRLPTPEPHHPTLEPHRPTTDTPRSTSEAPPPTADERPSADLSSATTSRPAPSRFTELYHHLSTLGMDGIVSIHVSGALSGTVESARLAAETSPIPVKVIDSRSIAMGLGYPVLAAARAAATGASLSEVAAAAEQSAQATRTFFYVDTLDQLRRSGRIGTAASLVGSALMIKPLLHIADGRILPLEKVRTATRAIARLEDLAVQAAAHSPVEIAVQHLAAPDRARSLAAHLPTRLPDLVAVRVVEVGPVIGIHVGPGMLGLTVTPAP